MKKLITMLVFCMVCSHVFSQRYLTYEYPIIDSLIGGTYGTAVNYLGANQNLLYDFYAPLSDTSQKRPLLIYIHGGGFTSGTRSYPSIKLLCRKMAMKGYAVATIDYRLDPNFLLYNSQTDRRAMTDAMHDAKQAIRYFKTNASLFKLDTNKIFIGGESAGAITAMMASYVDKQSEMSVYPMANPNNPIGSNAYLNHGNRVNATMCLCGMILDTTAIENSTNPPILWTHGTSDAFIPIALAFNVVLRAAHIDLPIQTKVYQNATHCPWYFGNPHWEAYLDSTIHDITTFLYSKVNPVMGLNEVNSNESSLNAFLNPATDDIHIDLDKPYSEVRISIISSTGQSRNELSFHHVKQLNLDSNHLEHGLYILKVELDHRVVLTKRMVIAE